MSKQTLSTKAAAPLQTHLTPALSLCLCCFLLCHCDCGSCSPSTCVNSFSAPTLAALSVEVFRAGVAPRCESRACNPRMGNLALGRQVLTQTVCGHNGTELHCSYSDPNANLACGAPKCAKCNAGLPLLSHLPGAMSDSSFRHPNTWWQSAEGVEAETVQLDLEAEFYFTHLILVFRSPRPAAMTLERSRDFGKTWKMLQYYADNCSATYGFEEGKKGTGRDGATCTSKYSGAYPCNRGEVRSNLT